jgi:nucleotidyltransferase AbiEii toxin of type IV toxin-antitoxin system
VPDPTAQQQEHVTAVLLTAIGEFGFALAGAGAIRAHGLTDRPTQDIDLFGGPTLTADDFSLVLQRAEDALRTAHYDVTRVREFPLFTRMRVTGPDRAMLNVDFAINWRADPPVQMGVGPVLSEHDAVAGKLSAVYSRGEVRDFLDLDAIRTSGRYTDPELMALGHKHDDGSTRRCSPSNSPA